MTGYNGLNSVKTNLAKAGICKHDGLRFTDPKCTHATADQIAYTKKMDADYDFMQEHKEQARLCNSIVQDVQPCLDFVFEILDGVETDTLNEHRIIVSRLDNGVDAVDAQRRQDAPDSLARARAIALPNGKLLSYATYKNTGKAQPLPAEEVDGERLGE